MAIAQPANRSNWLSDNLFPFASRFFAAPDGHLARYGDEGDGPAIIYVHGNPTWSFEFWELIKRLRSDFRCIAFDHIGFGLFSRSGNRK